MTQDEIVMCADASGISLYGMGKDREKFIHYLKAFAKLVAQYEREACAEVCKKHADFNAGLEPSPIAQSAWAACIDNRDTILARGKA